MPHRRLAVWSRGLVLAAALLSVAAGSGDGGRASIRAADLRDWLSYVASDELEGRANFSAGLGLAAAYVEAHLRAWNVKPAGDAGSFLQTVRVEGVKSTNRSTVTIEVGGRRRTFADGEGVVFPKNVGVRRRFVIGRVEFAGYGLDVPRAGHQDFRGLDVKGAAVVWLGGAGPMGLDAELDRNQVAGRTRYATQQLDAAASIGPEAAPPTGPEEAPGEATGEGDGMTEQPPRPDFTTVERLDSPVAPNLTAGDGFFEMLFSQAPVTYDELKRLAADRQPLPVFHLQGVTLFFDLAADYEVVRTQLTHNIVGVVDGSDPTLKDTYVVLGAHYDHLGYAQGAVVQGSELRRIGAPGRITPGALDDRIWNGADDDGSGTVALMAIARAFAQGPRPKRSVLFVWHAGEERGLWGSRYFADHPTIPLDRIVAQLDMDMIGRNRDDRPGEANTVYLVGSDRISSELDAISRAANDRLPVPLTLDYEMNDPADLEQIYYRSDHYSYAAKGIPVVFFTTGFHPDYHANTDEVSKIEFEKMTRVAQLVFETGLCLANLDHPPARDNRGPRAGRTPTSR
jgi:hypothetical protein